MSRTLSSSLPILRIPETIDAIPVGLPAKSGEVDWVTWREADKIRSSFPEQALVIGDQVDGAQFDSVIRDAVKKLHEPGPDANPRAAGLDILHRSDGLVIPEELLPLSHNIQQAAAALMHLSRGNLLRRTELVDRGAYYKSGLPWHVDGGEQSQFNFAVMTSPSTGNADSATNVVTNRRFTNKHSLDPRILGDAPFHNNFQLNVPARKQAPIAPGHWGVLSSHTIHGVSPIPEGIERPMIRLL